MKGGNNLGTLRYGGTGRQGLKKLQPPAVIPSDQIGDYTYGAPLKPGTPIKAVVGGFYGEIAGFQHKVKVTDMRQSYENDRRRMLDPPRPHTRASAMASTFVNDNTVKKADEDRGNNKDLFKMKKFNQVQPRTSSKNLAYVPTRRPKSACRYATRPNPI